MQSPRPSALVLTCAAMLALPAVLLIVISILGLVELARDGRAAASTPGPAWLGVIILPIPAALLIRTEYRAIVHRDARAAAWVAGLCLGLPVLGSIGWVEGLLRLTGFLRRDHDWQSWAELVIYSAVLAYLALVGLGHLHWWRVLRAAKQAKAGAWDEL